MYKVHIGLKATGQIVHL